MEGLDIALLPVEIHEEVGHSTTLDLLLPNGKPKNAALPKGVALLKIGQDAFRLARLKKLSSEQHSWAKRAELR